ESREDFVYLHHPDPSRRELLLYQCPPEVFYPSLHHQALLQFLRSHIQNPPLWLREGFAIFFEKIGTDPSSKIVQYKENLDWLDTLKGMIEPSSSPTDRVLIPLERFLFLTPEEARQNLKAFYPQAWGFVTFLLHAEDRSYSRFLWDTLSSLQKDASLGENHDSFRKRVLSFYPLSKVELDFKTYIQKRPSFTSLMKAGIAAYEKDAYKEAEEAFTGAVVIEPSDPLPYYYLGLVAYATKNYARAEEHYLKALSLGGPKGLIQYALGVNAFAWNRPTEARTYLTSAIEADPSFKEKAEPILKRLQR
ncbi:MAG: tetratricopeptide repeat protein, partial [Spirochaetes bacterium]|nr:tetratricopeptide repeat protein [Spirochaetota bacterium]